jgi:type IV pilus assembly protein PilC
MTAFNYSATAKSGHIKTGTIEAPNLIAAGHQIKEQGLIPLQLSELKESSLSSMLVNLGSVPLKEKIAFIQNLDLLLRSGVSAPRAMRIIAEQTGNKKFKITVSKMAEDVEAGKSMHESMADYPKIFSHIFVSMVEVGELSGNLEKSLEYLRIQLQREADLKSKTKGAMIYPSVIISAMVVIGIALAIFVLPSLTATFKDFDTKLPFTTRIVIMFSDFMAAHAILVIGGLIAAVVGFIMGMRTQPGKRILAGFMLNMPLVSPIVKKINMARFARILGSLMKSGISVVQGLQVTSDAMDNVYYREVLIEAAESVKVGKPVTEALSEHGHLFPFIVTQMLAIGEETGNLENILDQLAEHFEAEVDDTMKNMSSIIEPLLLLVIGVVVGFLALALISPIYNISNSIS